MQFSLIHQGIVAVPWVDMGWAIAMGFIFADVLAHRKAHVADCWKKRFPVGWWLYWAALSVVFSSDLPDTRMRHSDSINWKVKKKMYILAHDLGTSGNKATLFDESGYWLLRVPPLILQITLPATGRNRIRTIGGKPSLIPQALLELVSPNDIAGVALSGQMMGCLCVDKTVIRFVLTCFIATSVRRKEEKFFPKR